MSLYRHVGLSLLTLTGIMSFTLLKSYTLPLVLIVLTATMSLYFYLLWTRGLAQKSIYAFLLAPIFAFPLVYFYYKTHDPNVFLSQGAAMLMAVSLNLLIWDKRAVPQKRQENNA